ncbi:substrate-binding domain-containing protein [Curtobacterium sp. PhB130]|uniref:substrate-binding domain-containing protein n=1 Tax=Curtobacterium sp. PhB130 TaxID=2485178 RepID=UPI000F4D1A4D
MKASQQVSPPVGLVLVGPSLQSASELFYEEFLAGLEGVLSFSGITVVLQVVAREADERATYERWARGGMVSAVLLTDLAYDDDRVALLAALGIPTVVIGDPATAGPFAAVWTDDAEAMRDAVDRMFELSHRCVGFVSGPQRHAHVQIRLNAFRSRAKALHIDAVHIISDYTEVGGADATRSILALPHSPTAIIYDNDLMALGGVAAAQILGLQIPKVLSILAWGDSVACQLSNPNLAVMIYDIQKIGQLAADVLLALLRSGTASIAKASTASCLARASIDVSP